MSSLELFLRGIWQQPDVICAAKKMFHSRSPGLKISPHTGSLKKGRSCKCVYDTNVIYLQCMSSSPRALQAQTILTLLAFLIVSLSVAPLVLRL